MLEIQRILLALNSIDPRRSALATVVHLEGSGFRRPGARMLIHADGTIVGGVSAGCLESDVAEHAKQAIAIATSRLVTYHTDDDPVFGLGLGCDGHVRILLEPLSLPSTSRHLAFLAQLLHHRGCGAIATAWVEGESPLVGRWLIREGGSEGEGAAGSAVEAAHHEASEVLSAIRRTGRSMHRSRQLPCGTWLSVEGLVPPVSLIICGIGADAIALAEQARLLGWHVTVVDHRQGRLTPELMPSADRLLCLAPQDLTAHVELDERTAAVVMSHSLTADRALLESLLATPIAYLGVMGPRKRTARLLDGLPAASPSSHALYAPVGLDLGAESPEEVALAICAEIRAVLAGRRGGFLRERNGSIHDRPLVP
ncbi:XdhC family protein [bacterium]|nr:XdhC family protein [bacterium]